MLFVVLLAMTATTAATTAPGPRAPSTASVEVLDATLQALELPDQFGALRRLQPLQPARAHLLLLVEVGRLRRIQGFERDLRARVPALEVVRVAHVPAGSGATLARVSAHLRAHVPAQVSVLIDLAGRVAAALRADPRDVNAWVVAPDGRLLRHEQGRRSAELIARLAAALEPATMPVAP